MNNNEKRYLVSTAEDFLYHGVRDAEVIAQSLVMTAGRHDIDLDSSDLMKVLNEASQNCANGKKTSGILGWYPGVK